MINVEEIVYLGQTITSDGKNVKDINNRVAKGMGIVSEILEILENIHLGPYYFEIAMLFRNSCLINGMLFSADALYNLSKAQIEELSMVDRYFLRKVLKSPRYY